METLVIATTIIASFWGAFALQKAALEKFFELMDAGRRRN